LASFSRDNKNCNDKLDKLQTTLTSHQWTRSKKLRAWTEELAAQLRRLNVRTFPTETYFFFADFAPHDATQLADRLKGCGILIKPLDDASLGNTYMRITTALPADNARFVAVLKDLLTGEMT
jgi:histidinol-phosphate aminotransferase